MRLGLCIVATLFLIAVAVEGTVSNDVPRGPLIHHQSLEPPFIADWWQEGIPHWELGGDAVATDAFVRLTPQRPSRFGWVWNVQPNENPNWELRARLAVFGKRAPGADGIALWYAAEPYKTKGGSLFGNQPNFQGIGITFDTYDNDGLRDNPAVSFIENLDKKKESWNTDHDLREDAVFRCNFDFRHTTVEDPVEAIVQYYNKILSLRLRIHRRGVDVMCGEAHIDIPLGYYFGATASTGGMVDNHDVISLELRGLGDDAVDHTTPVEHFDEDADKRDRGFWGPQERKSGRQR